MAAYGDYSAFVHRDEGTWCPNFCDSVVDCQGDHIEESWGPKFCDSGENKIDLGSKVEPIIGTANDYAMSENKPSINGVTLIGDKTNEDLMIGSLSNMDIEAILNAFV